MSDNKNWLFSPGNLNFLPNCIFETSTFTGPPTALAFALGFQEATKGTTANDAPTAPTAAGHTNKYFSSRGNFFLP